MSEDVKYSEMLQIKYTEKESNNSDLSYVICLCHLDDLIVFGRDFKWIYEINNIKNERIGRCLFGVWSPPQGYAN